jgi:hypothetical protein
MLEEGLLRGQHDAFTLVKIGGAATPAGLRPG